MYNRITIITIFLAALAIFLPFNANLPVSDPVESNYALTAKEMLTSGDWLSPQIYGKYWFDKPIMIYWLIAVSFKLFGINEFAARLPSAVFSAASVAFVYWYTNRLFNNYKAAFFSALVLATSLEFWVLARMIITDATLFFFSSVSLAIFHLGIKENRREYMGLAYIFAGLAVLTKGPIGLLLPGLIVFVYMLVTRHWSLLKKSFIMPGLLLFLLTAGPWYYAMYLKHGQNFIDTFLGLHNYIRATVSEHPDDNVFYYYLILFPISLLPWTGVFLKALMSVLKRRQPNHIYLAIWLLVINVFYSLMATKYLTYVFPATFPAAILIGESLANVRNWNNNKKKLILTIPAILFFCLLLSIPRFITSMQYVFLLSGVVLVAILILILVQLRSKMTQLILTVSCFTILLSIVVTATALVPLAWTRSAKAIVQPLPKQGAIVGSYGDYMTSAVFYSGYLIPNLTIDVISEDNSPWRGKYTMPNESIDSFNQRTDNHMQTYILVKLEDQSKFAQEHKTRGFIPIVSFSTMTLYQKLFP